MIQLLEYYIYNNLYYYTYNLYVILEFLYR